jgi:hypothetical protein
MSIRNYTVTAVDSVNRGKIGGKHLAIETSGDITATLTPNGSLLLTGTGNGNIVSVNGDVGPNVVLDADDIGETLTRVYVSPTEKAQIGTNQTDIGLLQTDVGTLQTDVTNLQTDVSNNNGVDELVRTDLTGFIPAAIVPTLGVTEYHQRDSGLQNTTNGGWFTYTGGTTNVNIGLGTFNANGIFTCGVTGLYALFIHAVWAANSTGFRGAWVVINGNAQNTQQNIIPIAGFASVATYSIIRALNTGDTVQIQTYQNSGGLLQAGYVYRVARIQ